MSKRKGVSADDKRKRVLEIFYEKKDFFQLKDLEKIAPKEKGVVAQSVKDVVQNLVDDGMVESEKIGTSIYFWAFPSKATQVRKRKIDELESKLKDSLTKKEELEKEAKKAKMSRKDDDGERDQLIEELAKLRGEKEKLLGQIAEYKDSDPEVIAKEKNDIKVGRDSANRWTDNIFTVRSWLKNRFNMEEPAINRHFDIPDNLDYIE